MPNIARIVLWAYRWNDPIGSDSETYPESGSLNNSNARLQPEQLSIGAGNSGFNGLYTIIARTSDALSSRHKQAFIDARERGR